MIDYVAIEALGFELGREFEGRIGGFARDGKPWLWNRRASQ